MQQASTASPANFMVAMMAGPSPTRSPSHMSGMVPTASSQITVATVGATRTATPMHKTPLAAMALINKEGVTIETEHARATPPTATSGFVPGMITRIAICSR